MAETWVINESPNPVDLQQYINFISNNVSYSNFSAFTSGQSGELFFITYDGYFTYDMSWVDQNYRTVTFETAPTGDLLTWLQANAVKQEPPAPTEVKNIKLGSSNVDIKMGETQVVKVYAGNVLVWEKETIEASQSGDILTINKAPATQSGDTLTL